MNIVKQKSTEQGKWLAFPDPEAGPTADPQTRQAKIKEARERVRKQFAKALEILAK